MSICCVALFLAFDALLSTALILQQRSRVIAVTVKRWLDCRIRCKAAKVHNDIKSLCLSKQIASLTDLAEAGR